MIGRGPRILRPTGKGCVMFGTLLRHGRLFAAAALAVALALPDGARAGKAGDLVMADRGPWKLEQPLVWKLTHAGPLVPGLPQATAGPVSPVQVTDPSDGKPVLQLEQETDAGQRTIGPLPVSGGDPVVAFFLENAARDMAALSGGNPFHIRNRIKDALFRGGEVEHGADRTTVMLKPFAGDANSSRMGGFETLEIRFATDPDLRHPLRELVAETSGSVTPAVPAARPGAACTAPAPTRTAMVLQ